MIFECINDERKRKKAKYPNQEEFTAETSNWDYLNSNSSHNEQETEIFKEALEIVFNAYGQYIDWSAIDRLKNLDLAFVNKEQMVQDYGKADIPLGFYFATEGRKKPQIRVLKRAERMDMLKTSVHEIIHAITVHNERLNTRTLGMDKFGEGKTNYLTYKALLKAGKIDELSYNRFLKGSYPHETVLVSKLKDIIGDEAVELDLFVKRGFIRSIFYEAYHGSKKFEQSSEYSNDHKELHNLFEKVNQDQEARYKVESIFQKLTGAIKLQEIKKAMKNIADNLTGKGNLWDYFQSTVNFKQICGGVFADTLVQEAGMLDEVVEMTDSELIRKISPKNQYWNTEKNCEYGLEILRQNFLVNGAQNIEKCSIYPDTWMDELLNKKSLKCIVMLEDTEKKAKVFSVEELNDKMLIQELEQEQTETFKKALESGFTYKKDYTDEECYVSPEKIEETKILIEPGRQIDLHSTNKNKREQSPNKVFKGIGNDIAAYR